MSSDLALEHEAMIDVLHDPVKLGVNLRAARKSVGLIQEEAGLRLGMARTTIIAIEQGTRHVRVEELQEMAKLYECDFSLFFIAPEPPAEPVLSARKRVLKRVFLRDPDTTMTAMLMGLNVPPKELERMAATLLHMLIEQEKGARTMDELRPLPIIEDRSPAQLKEDGDDRWPDGTVYTPPSTKTPTPEWFAEMQRLTSENAALRKIVLASSIDIRDVLEEEAFRLSESAAAKLDEVASHLQEMSA